MVKVCHMTSAHSQEDDRIFIKECVSLANAGYEVYEVARGESYDKNGVHIVGVGDIPKSRRKRMTEGAKRVYQKALELDCDIYHFHDPELLPYGLKLKKRGKKVIFDSHENTVAQIGEKGYIPKTARKIISGIYKSFETFIIKRFDAVVVPCTFDGKNIFEGRAKKTVFIANYPLLEEFYIKYDASAEKENYVCYVGLMCEANGTKDLIIASARARLPLVLAGNDAYLRGIKDIPEFNNVIYKGIMDRNGVFNILQHAVIGAYINRHVGQAESIDTFGIKVYEYMAMGLPIVVDKIKYSESIISKWSCGICVEQGNVDAITDAFLFLKDNPEEARRMGENGRRAVEREFNWGVEEKKLLKLYEELLGS